MSASDVSDTLEDARAFAGIDQVNVKHQTRLLSDNGPCYLSGELSAYLNEKNRHILEVDLTIPKPKARLNVGIVR